MADVKNTFIEGRMNQDLDERLISENSYRSALNLSVSSSESSDVGAAENTMGNTKIADLATVSGQTVVNAKTIGAVTFEAENLIYWFVSSDNFDGIYEYNEITNQTTRVLQSNTGKLNFSKDYLITGLNFINGFLYWTDNFNPPRKINIARSKSYFIDDSRIDEDLSVIFAPPLKSPKISMGNDGTESNSLEDKFIYFSYRYKNIDGQYSALSPFSAVAFEPDIKGFDYDKGNNGSMVNKYNYVDVYFNTGNEFVTDVQLVFMDTRSLNVSIIETINKESNNYIDFDEKVFRFKNNKNYSVLTSEQVTRLFDNVPLTAKAQDFVGNRVMYGNYKQFYDIDVDINFNVTFDKALSVSTNPNVPIKSFRSDRDYELGIVYLDDFGRSSTVLTSKDNSAYISPDVSSKGNCLTVEIKNQAPSWATHYRFAIKQAKGDYYNIFPITFFADGLYRYFKINKSDLDKVKVGEYLILKTDASSATLSNKKYKVLEIDNKEANFFPGSGEEGLYVKIKVDSKFELDGGEVQSVSNTGYGAGDTSVFSTNKQSFNLFNTPYTQYTEDPIHYGEGNPDGLTVISCTGPYARYYVKVITPDTYEVERMFQNNLTVIGSGNIVQGSNITVANITFRFNDSLYNVNDYYIVNHRGGIIVDSYVTGPSTQALRNTAVINLDTSLSNFNIKKGANINLQVKTDRLNSYVNTATQSFIADRDYLNIEEFWYESDTYKKFIFKDFTGREVNSRAIKFVRGYVGTSTGSNADYSNNFITQNSNPNVLKTYPLNMLITSSISDSSTNEQPQIIVSFSLRQSDTSLVLETEAEDDSVDVYHELSQTYNISGGNHKVMWSYEDFTAYNGDTNLGQASPGSAPTSSSIPHRFLEGETIFVRSSNNTNFPTGTYTIKEIRDPFNIVLDFPFPGSGPVTPGSISWTSDDQDQQSATTPARVKINNVRTQNSDFNAWSFGNGLESYRLRDDWNEPTSKYSIRVNSTVDDYKQRQSIEAICYSGIYGMNTGVDRLNEFNLSLANFKYLDINDGSIQRLHSRDTDLLVFQQDKISKVLYGKNLLFDAVGGGQVASIPEVLGTQVSYPLEYGISNNPESFAEWGSDLYFTDTRRGSVLKMEGDSLGVISKMGMVDFFRDEFSSAPNTQKLGGYDVFRGHYVISGNDIFSLPCLFSIDRSSLTLPKNNNYRGLFNISSNSSWSISLIDEGFGTDWISLNEEEGSGDSSIYAKIAQNNTGSNRNLTIRITHCNGNITNFTLTQAKGFLTEVVPIVINQVQQTEERA